MCATVQLRGNGGGATRLDIGEEGFDQFVDKTSLDRETPGEIACLLTDISHQLLELFGTKGRRANPIQSDKISDKFAKASAAGIISISPSLNRRSPP